MKYGLSSEASGQLTPFHSPFLRHSAQASSSREQPVRQRRRRHTQRPALLASFSEVERSACLDGYGCSTP